MNKLKNLGKEELHSLLLELSSLNKENADFLRLKLENKPEDALTYYKKKLKNILWNERINLREARKTISDFKRISKNPGHLLELMIYYVETGVKIGEQYGDMYEAFYSSMESMFEQTIKTLNNNPILMLQFRERLNLIIERSCEGWGHKDTLEDLYEELNDAKIQ